MEVGGKGLRKNAELHVLLLTSNDERGARLLERIEGSVPKKRLEVYGNIEGLVARLRAPEGSAAAAILLVLTDDELAKLVGISRLLCDLRLILILPDRDDSTIAMGHMLHPRFVSYIDTDFRDVAAVLGKMMNSISQRARIRNGGGGNASEVENATKGERRYKKVRFR